jgi:hypothetical protein
LVEDIAKQVGAMPERFLSGAYDPELTVLMGAALDSAWSDFAPRPKNEVLARSLMASAIIEAVEAGERNKAALVRKATVALMAAVKVDPKLLERPAPVETPHAAGDEEKAGVFHATSNDEWPESEA